MSAGGHSQRFIGLDVLRGLAALAVFLFHCTIRKSGWQDHPLRLGVTGVDLFFMISGFVIFQSLSHAQSLSEFFLKRITRLYPAYWAAVTFTAALILFQSRGQFPAHFITTYTGNLTMIQNMLGIPNMDEQFWTLEVELLFYATIGVIFGIGQMNKIENISLVVLLAICASSITGLFPPNTTVPLQHIAHAPVFISGVLFYRIVKNGKSALRITTLTLALATSLLVFTLGGRSRFYISQWEYLGMITVFAVVFFLAITNRLRILHIQPLLFFGRISYCFYLIHQYVSTRLIIPQLEKRGMPTFLAILLSLGICTLLAWLMHRYLENPIASGFKKRMGALARRTGGSSN